MKETAVEETARAEVPAANNTEKEAAAAAKEDEPVTSSTDATPSVLPLATNAPSNDNKKIDTLIRVVQATKDGKRYIEGDADWYKMVDQLKEYIKENGDCDVHDNYETNQELCHWVANQRKLCEKKILPQERVDILNGLGFEWTINHRSWQQQYLALKKYKAENGDCNVPSRYKGNLGKWVGTMRRYYSKKTLAQDRIDLLEKLGFVWDHRSAHWEEMFQKLSVYKEQYGHVNPTLKKGQIEDEATKVLRHWVRTQRDFYKNNRMSPERIRKLEGIGFVWNDVAQSWDVMYQKLREYIEQNGHCKVPQEYDQIPGLFKWTRQQRKSYRESQLSDKHINQLEEIGFEWGTTPWTVMYNHLVEFKKQNGHCKVPEDDQHSDLYKWTSTQASRYKSSQLSDKSINLLEEIGFDWDERYDDKWQQMYEDLKAYKEQNGNCTVPSAHHNAALVRWIKTQRKNYKSSSLSEDRISLLNEIGMPWEPQTDNWDAMYQKLLEYKEKHGNCDVSKNYNLKEGLGSWVKYTRRCFKNKKLSAERISRLEAAGFSWTMEGKRIIKTGKRADSCWDDMFQKMLKYKEENGDCLVPKGYAADVSLANWVRNTRQQYRKNVLYEDRVRRLEEIGFAFTVGIGKYDHRRSPCKAGGKSDMELDDEIHAVPDMEFHVASPAASYDEESNDAEEEKAVHNQQGEEYWQALNETRQENMRLAEVNRLQAEEIARLRAALVYRR